MLYILSSPIGNLEDLSDRAKRVLREVDFIIAENPGYSQRLFKHLQISTAQKKFIQFAEHNEQKNLALIIKALKISDAVLLSDAGTPGISDPGFRVVRAAVAENIPVVPIPGANAAISALCASGLPTDKFIFLGFVPKTEIKFTSELKGIEELQATVIFYESPQRIAKSIGFIANNWPNAKVVIAREITKMHEEFIRGSAVEVLEKINARGNIKGEITVLVSFK